MSEQQPDGDASNADKDGLTAGQQQAAQRSLADLMIPLDSYPHVNEQATLADAIAVITNTQIERRGKLSLPRVVLVIDEDDQLLGLLRRRDILRGLLPNFQSRSERSKTFSHFEHDQEIDLELAQLFDISDHSMLTRHAQRRVTEFMQPFENSIDLQGDIMELIRKMVVNQFHFLPVTSHGQVLGVVRTVEVLNHVRRLLAGE